MPTITGRSPSSYITEESIRWIDDRRLRAKPEESLRWIEDEGYGRSPSSRSGGARTKVTGEARGVDPVVCIIAHLLKLKSSI